MPGPAKGVEALTMKRAVIQIHAPVEMDSAVIGSHDFGEIRTSPIALGLL